MKSKMMAERKSLACSSLYIKTVKNLDEAVNYKNKKVLLSLEDYSIDEGALKIIGEKQAACFLIDFSRIIKSNGVHRSIELSRIRTFFRYCIKYNVFFAITNLSSNEQYFRTDRELLHIAMLLGLDVGKAKNALMRGNDYI